jgi:hypothetical protein
VGGGVPLAINGLEAVEVGHEYLFDFVGLEMADEVPFYVEGQLCESGVTFGCFY